MMRQFSYIVLGILLLAPGSCRKRDTGTTEDYVVVVSFDGFRWDYADLYETPSFHDLAGVGVHAEKMIPSFPTRTFPNHYTLATGLYPDHHGIINNGFYAPDLDRIYRIPDRDMVQNPDAYFGEPVWVTAEKQGVRSASFFWVGSEAPIKGTHPSYWKVYDGSVPYIDRIDTVIHWLKLPPESRPRLVMLYFDEPDHTGHDYGPQHQETGKVVATLDSVLGTLRSEISKLQHADRINLIVTSDHGMASISPQRYVNLTDHLKEGWTERIIGSNPLYLVSAADGYEDSVSASLKEVEGVFAWKKGEIPPHLHYGSSERFPGLVVLADEGWSIGTQSDPSGYTGGTHGYDNAFEQMHTIFYAEGPAFRKGYVHPEFPNVDVYGIICHILDLEPAENDGDLSRVRGMFSSRD